MSKLNVFEALKAGLNLSALASQPRCRMRWPAERLKEGQNNQYYGVERSWDE
jgi:hypothetical protein